MALMSYPNMPAIAYKGYGGFLEKEECEEKRIIVENMIADYETQRGNTNPTPDQYNLTSSLVLSRRRRGRDAVVHGVLRLPLLLEGRRNAPRIHLRARQSVDHAVNVRVPQL